MAIKSKEAVLYSILLGVVLVAALALRLYGIKWGLPSAAHPNYSYHPDEAFVLIWARWLVEGQLIPKHFGYGGTFYYSILYAFIVFGQWLGDWLGGINLLANSILFGRYFLTLIALVSILLIYECGRILFDRATGLVVAFLLAVIPGHVMWAQQVRPDEIGVLLALLTLYLAARTLRGERIAQNRVFIYAGVLAGLALAFRFTLVVFAALPFLALFLRQRRDQEAGEVLNQFLKRGGIAIATAFAAYVVTSPYTLIHFREAVAGIQIAYAYQTSIFPDAFDNGPLFYQHLVIALPQALGYGVYILALAGTVYALKKRSDEDWMILTGVVLYGLLLVSGRWVMVRYTLPLVPLLLLLAARLAVQVVRQASARALKFVAMGVVALAILWSAFSSLAFVQVEASQNVREVAAQWFEGNVAAGASVLMLQSYAGDNFFNPVLSDRFRVERFILREESDSARLFSQGRYDYIVLHEPIYRNMERLGARHPLKQSRIFFESLKGNGYEFLQEFKTPVTFAGMDFSGAFTALDYLVVNPGIRVYRWRG